MLKAIDRLAVSFGQECYTLKVPATARVDRVLGL